MRLSGRCALVTGGSRGIGKGIALELAKAGANVAITYRQRADQAEETVAEMEALNVSAAAYQCDVSQPDSVATTVESAASTIQGLDIVVHNAAVQGPLYHVSETTAQDMRDVMDVNFFSAFDLTRYALPHMRKASRGDLIFISSSGTKHRREIALPYLVSKSAVESMATHLAAGLAQWGIHVNVVAPSLVDTEMTRSSLREVSASGDLEKDRGDSSGREFLRPASQFPFGRILRADEVGKACAFLCSEDAGYVSGQVLYLDGGAGWT